MRGLVRLSTETDRVYTINLGKVLLSPNNRRAKRAINMIREFARHHMGISEVKIDMDVSHIIWSKGIRSPPRKIRVRMRKTDEGNILISKYEADPTAPSKVEDAKAKPDDTKKIPAKEDTDDTKPADVFQLRLKMLQKQMLDAGFIKKDSSVYKDYQLSCKTRFCFSIWFCNIFSRRWNLFYISRFCFNIWFCIFSWSICRF